MYNDYFADHPPVHMLVAAYMGYEPKGKSSTQAQLNFDDFVGQMPGVTHVKTPKTPQAENG